MGTVTADLPFVSGLSEPQVRGKACVWCAVILDGIAIDLGTQEASAAGATVRWFPRCCRRCNVLHAYNVVLEHLNGCTECTADAEAGTETKGCETGRALRKVWREARS